MSSDAERVQEWLAELMVAVRTETNERWAARLRSALADSPFGLSALDLEALIRELTE